MEFKSLYTGSSVRLTPLEIEKDAAVVSEWTYQSDVAVMLGHRPSTPMTVFEVRKVLEDLAKNAENSGHTFVFALRPLEEERILGLFWLSYVQWIHGAGQLNLVIGAEGDWQTFSSEALTLALNYVFDELNLFRVTVRCFEDDLAAIRLYQSARFAMEVRQRQAVFRAGCYLDGLMFGLLRSEWAADQIEEVRS
jgi:RimJ/RimL family protein N-acetyltransferase